MKILYDPAKARANKERVDAEIESENEKIRAFNKKSLLIFRIILISILIVTILSFYVNVIHGFLVTSFFLFFFIFVMPMLDLELVKEERNPYDIFGRPELRYPTDTLFYLATNNKKVVKMWLEEVHNLSDDNNNCYILYFSYEDTDGKIQEDCIYNFLSSTKIASVAEPTAVLSESTVYIPCNP